VGMASAEDGPLGGVAVASSLISSHTDSSFSNFVASAKRSCSIPPVYAMTWQGIRTLVNAGEDCLRVRHFLLDLLTCSCSAGGSLSRSTSPSLSTIFNHNW